MPNLLKETEEALKNNGLALKDVLWIGSEEFFFDWSTFKRIADRDYDDGFGGQEVVTDLVIVGFDWWLERHEHDGSEWWEFKRVPLQPKICSLPETLFSIQGWEEMQLKQYLTSEE